MLCLTFGVPTLIIFVGCRWYFCYTNYSQISFRCGHSFEVDITIACDVAAEFTSADNPEACYDKMPSFYCEHVDCPDRENNPSGWQQYDRDLTYIYCKLLIDYLEFHFLEPMTFQKLIEQQTNINYFRLNLKFTIFIASVCQIRY